MPAIGRELDRVREQVRDDLPDPRVDRGEGAEGGGGGEHDPHVLGMGERLDGVDRLANYRGEVDLGRVDPNQVASSRAKSRKSSIVATSSFTF